jgi:hypothetical protein
MRLSSSIVSLLFSLSPSLSFFYFNFSPRLKTTVDEGHVSNSAVTTFIRRITSELWKVVPLD